MHFGFSDSSLNSRNPFSPTRAPFQSKLWGGRILGPLSKKASFSTDIEGRNVEENAIINATILDTQLVPTPFRQTVITPQTRFNITQRVDYALNTNNRLVARYSFNPTTADNRGVGDFALPSRAFDTKDTDHTPSLIGYSTARIQTLRKQSIEKFKAKQGENIGPYMDAVSPGYVASMGMRILEGRDFRDNDTENTALINKKFADKYFGGRAVSRHTGFGGNPETTTPIEIVGVYSDARYENLRDQVPIQMSIPV